MILHFTTFNSGVTFVIALLISLVLKKYYYGGIVAILSFFMLVQSGLLKLTTFQKYTMYSAIPAYVSLIMVILTSLYIIYKSSTINVVQTTFTIIQLTIAIGLSLALKFSKNSFDLLRNSTYINYLPSFFLLGFIISVSIIKDNQDILKNVYVKTMKYKDDYRQY